MDHKSAIVVHGSHNDPHLAVLMAVAAHKKCAVTHIVSTALTLAERNLVVMGFWPAFDYLEERHPFPPLLTAEVQERAVIRSIAGQVLANPDAVVPSLLKRGLTAKGFLLFDHPTLVDIIVATVPLHPTPPLVQKLQRNLGLTAKTEAEAL